MNKTRFGTVRLCAKCTYADHVSSNHGWMHWLVICFNSPYEYFDGKTMVKGKKNQCIIYPPYSPYRYGPDKDYGSEYEYNWIWLYGYGVDDLMETLRFPFRKAFDMGEENCVTPFLLRIINEQKADSFFREQYISSIIYEMLVTLARNRQIAATGSGTYTSIETAHKYIRENYDKKLNLEMLSKISGYSASRFSGLYKEIYNISPIADLLNVRIDNAKELLFATTYSINKISEECGFESIHYFSSKFKEITKMSPLQFRNSHKNNIF